MNDIGRTDKTGERLDLRGWAFTLWYAKWIILGTAISAALIALLISSFLLPIRYQSSVAMTITELEFWTKLYQRNLTGIAKSDELIELSLIESGVTDPEQQDSLVFAVSLEYWGLMYLEVIAEDPALAADAANSWANLVYERLIEVLGTSEEDFTGLQEQVSFANENLSIAQTALNTYLDQSQLEVYNSRLTAAQSALVEVLLLNQRNQLLISDARTLQQQIEGLGSIEKLNTGTVLSLINLQGRATLREESELILPQDSTLDLDLSSDEALLLLQQFMSVLETQNGELNSKRISLEDEINELAGSVEIEQHQVDQLTLNRDQAVSEYIKLAEQLENFKINQNKVDQAITISTKAIPSADPISPDILSNTMFAGMSTALVSMVVIILFDWWTSRNDSSRD